jgi:hypothetical protein
MCRRVDALRYRAVCRLWTGDVPSTLVVGWAQPLPSQPGSLPRVNRILQHSRRSHEITWNCCGVPRAQALSQPVGLDRRDGGPLVAPVRSGPVLANPAFFRRLTTGSSWSVLNHEAPAPRGKPPFHEETVLYEFASETLSAD